MYQRLTPRQREALILRANGHDNQQTAAKMYIGHETVKTLLAQCYRKLGVSGAPQATAVTVLITDDITIEDIHVPDKLRDGFSMRRIERRCRICRSEEGKQHNINCSFVRYQMHYPGVDVYIEVLGPALSTDSSSSCDTGSTDAGSYGG